MTSAQRRLRLRTKRPFASSSFGGASPRRSLHVRLRSTALQHSGASGSGLHRVTAHHKRKHGFFHRFRLAKLFRLAVPFIPGGGLLISAARTLL